jgi:3-oxoacyl-[acyl-carrier protein] reductase
MENKTVLITGTSRGIGRHLAEHYLSRGLNVIGCSRSRSTLDHPRFQSHALDIADEKAVLDMLTRIRRDHDQVDVLINNAGTASMNHLFTTPMESVRRIFDTNFVGTFLLSREVGKLMQRRKYGRIVNLVTVAVPMKLAGEAVYAASKAAVVSLTEVLSHELAPYGITVNALGPTAVQTDLIKGVPKEKLRKVLARQAIPRIGEFSDVVNVIDFLISPASGFVTGQTIYLGGV